MILITCSLQQCSKQVINKIAFTVFDKKSLILILLAFWTHTAGQSFDYLKLLSIIENIQIGSVLSFLSDNIEIYFFKALMFIAIQTLYNQVIASYFKKEYQKEKIRVKRKIMDHIFHYEKINKGKINLNKLLQLQKFYMNSVEKIIEMIASFFVFIILSALLPGTSLLWLEVCVIIVAIATITIFATYFIHKQIDSQILEAPYNTDWFNLALADIVYFFFLTTTCYFIPMYILKRGNQVGKNINLFVFYITLFQNVMISNQTFFKDFIRSWIEIKNIMKETDIPSNSQQISTLNLNSNNYDLEFSLGNFYWICSDIPIQNQIQTQILYGDKKINSQISKANLLKKCNIVTKENTNLSILKYFQLALPNVTEEEIIKMLSICKFFEGGELDFVSNKFLKQKCSSFSEIQQNIIAISRSVLDQSDIIIFKDCFRAISKNKIQEILNLLRNKKIVIFFSGPNYSPPEEDFVLSQQEEEYALYYKSNL